MNDHLLILGGGFGMYGYLPAALQSNWQVSTLERYRPFLNSRAELVDLTSKIAFVREEDLSLDSFAAVVIARNPVEQSRLIQQTSGYKGHYFLEKPIGPTPESSLEILNILQSRFSTFSIAYLFRYQDWYKKIISGKGDNYLLSLKWSVPRIKNASWKNQDLFGGGLLSYYGIHLLSLIVELDSNRHNLQITYKPDFLKIESRECSRSFQIELSMASSPAFEICLSKSDSIYHWSGESPFGPTPNAGFPDPRIPSLVQYLSESRERNDTLKVLLLERKIQELRDTISRFLLS